MTTFHVRKSLRHLLHGGNHQRNQKALKEHLRIIALLAGAVGGILGVNASGASIFNRVSLVFVYEHN